MKSKITIYQVLVRLFGNLKQSVNLHGTINENGCGKFNYMTAGHLKEISDLGITHVWYTGILEHASTTCYEGEGLFCSSPETVKGLAGSPFAVRDYYDVDPDLADDINRRMLEFEALVDRTHETGLKVIIDFIPNHVAREYHSDAAPEGADDFGSHDDRTSAFSRNNNFYYIPGESLVLPGKNEISGYEEFPAKATGNDVFSSHPSETDWYDTVKLNYGTDYQSGTEACFKEPSDTWMKMRHILLYWADKGVDGFRCDMVEMIPPAFWSWVIFEIKKNFPEIIFIGEAYSTSMYNKLVIGCGFDFLYDKSGLYDALKAVMSGYGRLHDIRACRENTEGIDDRMLVFLENHDELRITSPLFAGDAFAAVPAMILSASFYSGAVMIYAGQEVGENESCAGGNGRTTIFDYFSMNRLSEWYAAVADGVAPADERMLKLRGFYRNLLNLCRKSPALASGKYVDAAAENKNVFAFFRIAPEQTLLVAVNFDRSASADAAITMPEETVKFHSANEILYGEKNFEVGEKILLKIPANEGFIIELR